MSDPVTHEIDLEWIEAVARDDVEDRCDFIGDPETIRALIARLRAAEARAEAAEAERDALRARVPTEDEIEALEVAAEELDALETRELAACGYSDAGPRLSALRALVARNTTKENPDGE